MNAFGGLAAGGLDMGTLLMMAQLQGSQQKDEVEATAVDTLLQRLDGLEAKLAKQKGK